MPRLNCSPIKQLFSFLTVVFLALPFAAPAHAQSSSSITVNGVSITVMGGSSQSVSSTSTGAQIELDGRTIVVEGTKISVDGSSIDSGAFSEVVFDASGSGLKVIVDGETRMTLSTTQATEEDEGYRLTNLGYDYYIGEGVEQSYEKAIELFIDAAENHGNPTASSNLAIIFWDGIGDIPADRHRALKYAPLAAEHGINNSIFYMGVANIEGMLGEVDIQAGVDLLNQAIDVKSTLAMNYLGSMYLSGDLIEQSDEKAAALHHTAADMGDSLAAVRYAAALWDGAGVEKNVAQALTYATQGAEDDYIRAIFILGLIHDFGGDGVPINDPLAIEYYTRAAENNHSTAAFNLALMYRDGEGTDVDLEQAIQWMHRASELGYPRAPDQLELLKAQLAEQDGATATQTE